MESSYKITLRTKKENQFKYLKKVDEDPDGKRNTLNIMICLREPAQALYERRELIEIQL